MTKSVVSLLNYYRWNKFSIIFEQAWEKVAESLSEQAIKSNKTINHKRLMIDRDTCCFNGMKCCHSGSSTWFDVSFKLIKCSIHSLKKLFSLSLKFLLSRSLFFLSERELLFLSLNFPAQKLQRGFCYPRSFQTFSSLFNIRRFTERWMEREFTSFLELRVLWSIWCRRWKLCSCSTKENTWSSTSIWWVIRPSKNSFRKATLNLFFGMSINFQGSKKVFVSGGAVHQI